jgi:hypothetical protein
MALRLSTGLVNALNVTDDFKGLMVNSVIYRYSGTQPVDADAIETGTLLDVITLNAGAFTPGSPTNGLNMGTSIDGVLSKDVAEVWQSVGLAAAGTGTTAGWFRWYANDRIQGASTVAIRLDGAIGTSSSYEMRMSNTSIVEGNTSSVSTFTVTQPKT